MEKRIPLKDGCEFMLAGTVAAVSYDMNVSHVTVTVEDQERSILFVNRGKFSRSDEARSLRLKQGDEVIAIGVEKNVAPGIYYGWRIKRKGTVSDERYLLLTGSIRRKIDNYVRLTGDDGRTYTIQTENTELEAGKKYFALCIICESRKCLGLKCEGTEGCRSCSNFRPVKKYRALEVQGLDSKEDRRAAGRNIP